MIIKYRLLNINPLSLTIFRMIKLDEWASSVKEGEREIWYEIWKGIPLFRLNPVCGFFKHFFSFLFFIHRAFHLDHSNPFTELSTKIQIWNGKNGIHSWMGMGFGVNCFVIPYSALCIPLCWISESLSVKLTLTMIEFYYNPII